MDDIGVINIAGAARIRLIDERAAAEAKKIHPHWPYAELRELIIKRGHIDYDSDWQTNTVVDNARRQLAYGTNALGTAMDIFIHQSQNPGNVKATVLQNAYRVQTPSQVVSPDTQVFDEDARLQTRTVQFTAPSVARNINIAGLVVSNGGVSAPNVNAGQALVFGIAAYTLLSSTIVQGTSQNADVQYRLTFSFDI